MFGIKQVLLLSTVASALSKKGDGRYTVLVVGDSWASLGPSWLVIQDIFEKHDVDVYVKAVAIPGTSACQWYNCQSDGVPANACHQALFSPTPYHMGESVVQLARNAYPDEEDGPDFLWYSLGANDIQFDTEYQSCMQGSDMTKHDAEKCLKAANNKIMNCTGALLDNYFKAFPKSKVMQCNYDIPCENDECLKLLKNGFLGGDHCGDDRECINSLLVKWQKLYVDALQEKYPRPQYTGLNILGTVQKAAGIEGADVGNPVLHKGADCRQESMCIHPTYDKDAANAIGQAFWDLFFSKHVDSDRRLQFV